jgi:hypothetical protein
MVSRAFAGNERVIIRCTGTNCVAEQVVHRGVSSGA